MSTTVTTSMATALQRVALTIAIALVAVAIILIPGTADMLQYDREAIAAGQAWRTVTGHLTHWDRNQLTWDLTMFVALGIMVEPRSRRRFTLLCLVSAIGISGSLWWRHPELATYRGLSGLDTALFVYVATGLLFGAWRERRLTPGLVSASLLVGFLAKLGYEVFTGQTLFVDSAASGFAVITLAHSVGAIVGGGFALYAVPGRARVQTLLSVLVQRFGMFRNDRRTFWPRRLIRCFVS